LKTRVRKIKLEDHYFAQQRRVRHHQEAGSTKRMLASKIQSLSLLSR